MSLPPSPPPPYRPPPAATSFGPATAGLGLPRSPQRLDPLSPVVRAGRSAVGLLVLLSVSTFSNLSSSGHSASGNKHDYIFDIVLVAAAVILAVVSWAVTTWWLDGDALQVATGMIRRQNIRVPLARIQAVDLVQPWLARVLGLAEVRVRTGGGSKADARLMYLKIDDADRVRSSLLALAHGLSDTTPAPAEWPLVSVANDRLVGSVLLSGTTLWSVIAVGTLIGLALSGRIGAAILSAGGSTLVVYLFLIARTSILRVASEWGFHVAEAPDGFRIRCGLLSRIAETVPAGRVQSVRMLEPLWWRPLGWCRLELHLAGGVHKGRSQGSSTVRRALLPVGTRAEADMLLARVLPNFAVPFSRPPARAIWKAPFSFHFLAAGHNDFYAAGVRGRLRRLTEWAPLAKAQSIRQDQGPIQRWLGLASVHLDIAGRRSALSWLERSSDEADSLMATLPGACAADRDRESALHRNRQRSPGGRRTEAGAGPAGGPRPATGTPPSGAQAADTGGSSGAGEPAAGAPAAVKEPSGGGPATDVPPAP
jgi:putative membrane protein